LLVLRGFSRNVKQDSEASRASGGVSEANVAILKPIFEKNLQPVE
jgi:hypothetical protein